MRPIGLAVPLAFCALAAIGTAGCPHRRPPVEFHSDAGTAVQVADTATVNAVDGGRFVPVAGTPALGDGRGITVAGATIPAPDGERFGVYLPVDLDGNGVADDAVATRLRADGTSVTAVTVYRRTPTGFTPVPLAGVAVTDPRCGEVSLRLTSPRSLVVTLRCASPGGSVGGAPGDFTEEQSLVALGVAPLVRYRAAVLPALPGEALTLALEGTDRDGDGRDDIVVRLGAGAPGRVPRAEAQVVMFDRPSGTARDVTEPAGSLDAVVAAARRQASGRRSAAAAVGAMQDLGRLRRALCADLGTARFRLGNVVGMDCTAVAGTFAQGAEVLARAWVTLGELPAAFSETRPQTAGDLGVAAGERLQTDLERAAVPERGVMAIPGPTVAQPLEALVPVRSGVLTLDPPDAPVAVWLHGPVTGRLELATMTFSPGPPGDVRDLVPHAADGALAVVGFAETCGGAGTVLCPRAAGGCDQPMSIASTALAPGATLSRFASLPSMATAVRCVGAPGTVTVLPPSEGARVLGWGRLGPVFVWQGRMFRATGADAVPLGPADPLGSGYQVGGGISPRGGSAVLNGPEGVWLRTQRQWHLWAPAALAGRYAQLTDLTVSEDGRIVVGLMGGQVWLLERPRSLR